MISASREMASTPGIFAERMVRLFDVTTVSVSGGGNRPDDRTQQANPYPTV
jgi:hypothetical protein